ncbi:MAG: ribulose-phosphate 3-epimerase [Myxococcota bacterium]
MTRFRIAPSILSADFSRLGEEIRAAEAAGGDWIHIDVMDGHFVPNLTVGPLVVAAVKEVASSPLDVHLMIEEPDRYLEPFVEAGASTVGVHVEACRHLHRTLERIRALGARACVALNPATPAAQIEPVLPDVDQVLVMTVNPGFGGQRFIKRTLPKIREIRAWIDEQDLPVDLVIDGGVGPDTVEAAARAGARVFVMGSAFFGSPDYKATVETLRTQLLPFEGG